MAWSRQRSSNRYGHPGTTVNAVVKEFRFIVGAAFIVLGAAACKTDEPTDPSDETDTGECGDGYEREDFYSNNLLQICTFAATCNPPPHDSEAQCLQVVRQSLDLEGCWDPCLAEQCADWLAGDPTCESEDARMIEACETMARCAED